MSGDEAVDAHTAWPAAGTRPGPRLRRSGHNRIAAGVVAGISEHLGIAALWPRAALFALSLPSPAAAWLLYLLGWLLLPDAGRDHCLLYELLHRKNVARPGQWKQVVETVAAIAVVLFLIVRITPVDLMMLVAALAIMVLAVRFLRGVRTNDQAPYPYAPPGWNVPHPPPAVVTGGPWPVQQGPFDPGPTPGVAPIPGAMPTTFPVEPPPAHPAVGWSTTGSTTADGRRADRVPPGGSSVHPGGSERTVAEEDPPV